MKKFVILIGLVLIVTAGCDYGSSEQQLMRTPEPALQAAHPSNDAAPLPDLRKFEPPGCKNGKCPIPKAKPKSKALEV